MKVYRSIKKHYRKVFTKLRIFCGFDKLIDINDINMLDYVKYVDKTFLDKEHIIAAALETQEGRNALFEAMRDILPMQYNAIMHYVATEAIRIAKNKLNDAPHDASH